MAVDPAEEEGHLHGDQRDVASTSGESKASGERTASKVSVSSKASDPSSVRNLRCASQRYRRVRVVQYRVE